MDNYSVFKRAEYEQPDSRVFIVKLHGMLCGSDPSSVEDPDIPGPDNEFDE